MASGGFTYVLATDPQCAAGILAQTRNALHELDRLIHAAASDRTRLLQAAVSLSDIALKPQMDSVWRERGGEKANWP